MVRVGSKKVLLGVAVNWKLYTKTTSVVCGLVEPFIILNLCFFVFQVVTISSDSDEDEAPRNPFQEAVQARRAVQPVG